eukprot:2226251-Rhodomonas_salina.1
MDTDGDCQVCKEGAYCFDGMLLRCPLLSTHRIKTPETANTILGCVCEDGFILNTSSYTCDECGWHHYCANGSRVACPALRHTATRTATLSSQCVCVSGFFISDHIVGYACTPCQTTSYCPDGVRNLSCPPFQTANLPRTSEAHCGCDPGLYHTGASDPACEVCHADHFCTNGEMITCPPASWAMPGAENQGDCICETHFEDNETSIESTQCLVDSDIPTCMQLDYLQVASFDTLSLGLPPANVNMHVYAAGTPETALLVYGAQTIYLVHATMTSMNIMHANTVMESGSLTVQHIFYTDPQNSFSLLTVAGNGVTLVVSVSHQHNGIDVIVDIDSTHTVLDVIVPHTQTHTGTNVRLFVFISTADTNLAYALLEYANVPRSRVYARHTLILPTPPSSISIPVNIEHMVILSNGTIHTHTTETGFHTGCTLPDLGIPLQVLELDPLVYVQYNNIILAMNLSDCSYLTLPTAGNSKTTRLQHNSIGIHYVATIQPDWRMLFQSYHIFPGCKHCINMQTDINMQTNASLNCMACTQSTLEVLLNMYTQTCQPPNATNRTTLTEDQTPGTTPAPDPVELRVHMPTVHRPTSHSHASLRTITQEGDGDSTFPYSETNRVLWSPHMSTVFVSADPQYREYDMNDVGGTLITQNILSIHRSGSNQVQPVVMVRIHLAALPTRFGASIVTTGEGELTWSAQFRFNSRRSSDSASISIYKGSQPGISSRELLFV